MSLRATMTVRVEWGDCDPARIVFYPNYFRWFDIACRHLFETVGGGWEQLFDAHGAVGIPLVAASSRFHSPARFGDVLEIESRVDGWTQKAFTVAHVVRNGGEVSVEGEETRCWCVADPDDPQRLRAAPIPEAVLALFEAKPEKSRSAP